MPFPTGHQLTLINRIPAPQDDYGDDQVTVEEVTVAGAFDPGGYSEHGDTADTRPAALLPPGSDVSFTSAVRYAGIAYEVDGPPQIWDSPFTGTRFGVRVPLKAQLRR